MRQLKKTLWFVVALLFLLEAKLLDYSAPLIRRISGWLSLDKAKAWIARIIEPLNAWLVLAIFIVPLILVEPLKLVALWWLAQGHVIGGIVTFAIAEIGALAIVAFLFEVCKPKLMTIGAFAWSYTKLIEAKHWALQQVEPALRRIRIYRRYLGARIGRLLPAGGAWSRRLAALRRRGRVV